MLLVVAVGCVGGWYAVRGMVVGAQESVRSFALVSGHVDVMKHLLSATFAPTSAKYCRDMFMPRTAVAACPCLLAYKKRSSASTLGFTCLALIQVSQGFMSRAIRAMEKGHP